MKALPYEDEAIDVIGKAQAGLGLSDKDLAERAGLTEDQLARVQKEAADEEALKAVGKALRLNVPALLRLASVKAPEQAPPDVDGVEQFTSTYFDMTVNAYLVWDAESGQAIAFDSGADARPMVEAIRERGLTLKMILLTHTHGDHVADVDRLLAELDGTFGTPADEPFQKAVAVNPGDKLTLGQLGIEARATRGHSTGGTTYVIQGLARPVAIVGDAVFACSMGGAKSSYQRALDDNREQIFSLPDETLLCPGHGPVTTVGDEKKKNPFKMYDV